MTARTCNDPCAWHDISVGQTDGRPPPTRMGWDPSLVSPSLDILTCEEGDSQESMTFSSPLAAPGSLSARLKRAPLEVSSAAFERGPRAVSLQVCPSYTPLGFSGDTLQLGKYALKE